MLAPLALAVTAAVLIPHRAPVCGSFAKPEALPWVRDMRQQAGREP